MENSKNMMMLDQFMIGFRSADAPQIDRAKKQLCTTIHARMRYLPSTAHHVEKLQGSRNSQPRTG